MESWMDEECRWSEAKNRPPRRRAMAGLAIATVAGTAAGLCAPWAPEYFLGAGGALLLPLFVWVRRKWSTMPLMLAAALLAGAHAGSSVRGRPMLSLGEQMAREAEYVQFAAVATEDAVARPARPGQGPAAVFRARVEGLNRDGRWRRADDTVRVVLAGTEPGMRLPLYGERWLMRGLVRPNVPRRSGLFTLPENQAVVDGDRATFLDAGRGNPLKAWCMERRRAARTALGRGLEAYPEERGLLQALLLGYREDLPEAMRKDFAATGTVHIFAISGAHVGMVTMLLAGLLQALGVPRTRWFHFVAPALAAYTAMTGAATSAVRACAMAWMMLAAPCLKRKPDGISTLAAAAGLILLASPAQLGDLGFLLSFTAVGGLLAVQPVLDAWALRTFRRDDWQLPEEELPGGRRLREAGLAATRYGSVSVSAWLSTTPLTALFFNLFSPVAVAMNLAVIPTAFAILLAGMLSLASAPVSAGLSETFNHSARACAQALGGAIQWAARVPGGHWFVPTPPAAGVLLWYAILAWAAVAARRARWALPAGTALLAALALGWGAREATRCRVSVLDVGEGNAVLARAEGARILVDAGPSFRFDDLERQLREEGVNRIDALVLTHADADHAGAAPELMRTLPVGELWLPARTWPSPVLKAAEEEAARLGIPARRVRAGDGGDWPGGMRWEALWPPDDLRLGRADDGSLVLRVARRGASILLAADAGAAQERAMEESGAALAAPALLAGRHGDAGATTEEWLDAVWPADVLFSCGPHAEGRHPDEELLERLERRGVRIWRTDRQGTIRMDFARGEPRWPDRGYRLTALPRR